MLLVVVLGRPTSILALPTDAGDIDLDMPRRIDTPAAPSPWDQPAPPQPTRISPPPQVPQQTNKRTPGANPLWAVPLATLSNTRARPIFSATRRPPPSAAIAAAPVAKAPPPSSPRAERPQLSLVGTVVGNDASLGVFIDPATQAALRLKIGDDFQGWKLQSVRRREVTLTLDGQTAVLSLPQPDASKAAEPARGNANKANARHSTENDRSLRQKSRR
jgi:general secretion pathway protein N